MKYAFYFLLLILCGIDISCESPTQVNHTVINDPPVVTISGNNATLLLGDTLRLTLHAVDSTLTSGTVDFKDSTVVVFNNLKSAFDTTLIHIFTSVGSYNIIVSFTDGERITTKQFNVTVSPNDWPVVTLAANKDTINLGDTLKITLHASDATLSSGSIDFRDGTITTFSNLKRVIDTTIIHVYLQLGRYHVIAAFSDGHTSTNATISIVISHYFVLSFSAGMKWRFTYSYFSIEPPLDRSDTISGIHEWKIISYTVKNQDTTFTVQQIRNDTGHTFRPKDGGGWVDTTYAINDTSQFTFILSYSSVQMSWPLNWGIVMTYTVPNHAYVSGYLYNVVDHSYGGASSSYDIHGPYSYSRYFQAAINSISSTEIFSLIDFTEP